MGSFLSKLYTFQANMNRPPWKYDVFLSFRGEDTRHGFTSDLRAALREKDITTFLDEEIRRGQELEPVLPQAIRESTVAVVIFSRDFASSTWCLEEIVNIIECHETLGQVVLPVFYDVNPSDVKEQAGNFGAALARHTNVNTEKVQKWRAALTQVASIQPAWDSRVIRSERMLIDDIVQYVSKSLKQKMDKWENDIQLRTRYMQVLHERTNRRRQTMPRSSTMLGRPSGHHGHPGGFTTPGGSRAFRLR